MQVAKALAVPSSRTGVDPLSGLSVAHVIATGESQSAARLCTYIDAVHPLERFFSGFIPCVLGGGARELYDADIISGESADAYNKRKPFPEATLHALYPSNAIYVDEVRAAVGACELSDLILPYRAAASVAAAQR
jgi:hypothetical protein